MMVITTNWCILLELCTYVFTFVVSCLFQCSSTPSLRISWRFDTAIILNLTNEWTNDFAENVLGVVMIINTCVLKNKLFSLENYHGLLHGLHGPFILLIYLRFSWLLISNLFISRQEVQSLFSMLFNQTFISLCPLHNTANIYQFRIAFQQISTGRYRPNIFSLQ